MRKFAMGLALASTALASPALAKEGQWYIGVDAGAMIVDSASVDGTDISVDHDEGYDFGAVVGHDFGAFRLETEVAYKQANLEAINFGATEVAANGEGNFLSFMLNGLFDFGKDDGLQGFFGGGVGIARSELKNGLIAQGNAAGLYDDSDTGIAWQLLAGVRAPLTDRWDVGLKYRYFNAPGINIVARDGTGLETDVSTHSLLGTLTYNFGEEPAPPPPPPPPAPVCNTGPYIVFFNWDESDITPEAATVLDNAVTAYADCGTASVMLAGHTDRSGTTTYNMGLAERRNSSVRDYLNGRGIPDDRIGSEAFGESQPRVATEDGVRELQNRRVEVTYGPGSGM